MKTPLTPVWPIYAILDPKLPLLCHFRGITFTKTATLNRLHVLAAVAAAASQTRINVLRRRTDVPADFFVLLNRRGLSARSRSAQGADYSGRV